MKTRQSLYRMILAAMFLALAIVLPFLTAQIPQIGKSLCPMHLPVLLCGFFCGPWWGLAVGFIAPLLRSLLFGMPHMVPDAVGMCLELATYGLIAAVLYRALPPKKPFVLLSLVGAMLAGRVVWGVARAVMFSCSIGSFGWNVFLIKGFVDALPGIAVQLILVPILVITLKKYTCRT